MNRLRLAKGISVSLGLLLALVSFAAVARAQSAGHFLPPHSDLGVDLNGDSFFDVLRLQINVEATTPGLFFLVAELFDATNLTSITNQSTGFPLSGTTVIDLDFDGASIHDSGIDGPYQANLVLYSDAFYPIDYNEHRTRSYNHTDFNGASATFAPPYSDMGVDTDDDTLFDFLEVGASVNVTQGGTYLVAGDLVDSSFRLIDSAATPATLGPGNFTVPIDFSGWAIYSSGMNGPYQVSLYLFQSPFTLLDFDTYTTTGVYAYTDFETPPAALAPPHSDMGIDRNVPPDSEYNVLEVDVRVNVADAGFYELSAGLLDSSGAILIAGDGWQGPLSPGYQSVPLVFPGVFLRSAGLDGPYLVNMTLLTVPPGAFPVPIDREVYVTRAYNSTDFQSFTLASLTGVVRDADTMTPIPDVFVTAYNYLDSVSFFALANESGNYSLDLYAGDWVLTYDDPAHQSTLSRLAVSASTVHDVDLGPQQPVTNAIDLAFTSLGAADVKVSSIGETDNATFRIVFDWAFGNQDQVLDQQEFDAILALFGPGFAASPPDSADMFLVDGIPFDLVPGSENLTFLNLTGPIDSPTPPEFELSASYISNTTIPSATSHTIRLHAGYDSALVTSVYTVHLPSPFELTNFNASSTVTVSGLGTATAIVDPLQDPNPFDPITSEWVDLGTTAPPDTTRPTVAGASASPNPAEAGAPIHFSATVTDDQGVRAVSVEVSDGTGASLGNFTMSLNSATGKFEVSQSFARVGTLSFTVWASDDSGNVASSTGNVVVRDTSAPTVTGTTDSPDPVELAGTITISTQMSDAVGIDSAKVEIKDPTGAVVGNFTMTHGSGTAYSYQISPTKIGSYPYQITATDASGNARVVSGSFQVQDTTPPVSNAGPDRTVNQGTTVTFDGTGSSDGDGIASYAWTFTDGGSVSLSGPNPAHRFDHVGTYTVTLTVTDPSGNSDTDTVDIIVAATSGGISGTVVGPSGRAVSGATVRLLNGTTEVATTSTNATGQFSFSSVSPGSYTIRVEASGFESRTMSVSVTAGGIAPVSVNLVALGGGVLFGLGFAVWGGLLAVVVLIGVALGLLVRRRGRPPEI